MSSSSSPGSSGPSFFGAVWQIGGLTAISRLLGFGRDVILAMAIGAGPLADAFFVAFKLPNLFRRLTAEGAVTNAFLPAYAKAEKSGGPSAAARLAEEIQLTLLWGLVVFTLALELMMPVVISLLAPGFDKDGARFNDAVTLARITMPFLPMVSMVAFWAALTNANNRFLGGAAAPIILNIMLILGALLASLSAAYGAVPIAIAVPVAGVLQMLLMQRMLVAIDKRPRWGCWPNSSAAGKAMWRQFFAAALGAGGMQLNLLVDTILASLMPVGAISSLYYADRIAQLPLGVIGIALGTALLPRLSRLEAAGDKTEVRAVLARGVRLGMFFALPAMVGAIVLSEHIIGGLFGYGAFSAAMISPTAQVLMAYAVGIPAFVLAKIFQPSFYAANDPKTPLKIAMLTVMFNLVASVILMQVLGVAGLALATSLASWLSVVIMLVLLVRRGRLDGDVAGSLPSVLLATAVMGVVLYLVKPVVDDQRVYSGIFADAFGLLAMIGIGTAVYFAAGMVTGAMPRDLRKTMRQK
ncbi:MAG: murein biosynthesis integral membrane protein MurJ [Alphaproteobacteria bacterium]|nr:murein biosynthesis integral membrane protein MurJ [Alphaproteobacteria bacterium]